ncbi:MAG: FkbM family methyltransferase [Isosphaeraceae bacterium]
MTLEPISRRAEWQKSLIQALPARRWQALNWCQRLWPFRKPFVGRFRGGYLEVHPGEVASMAAYFAGFYERETTLLVQQIVEGRRMTIFDVGSNFGYFSLLCGALAAEESRIFAFEPDPANFAWLSRNLQLNPRLPIQAQHNAVSDRAQTVEFVPSNIEQQSNLWSHIQFHEQSGKPADEDTIKVPAIALDDFCDANSLETIDLVKIDVEGAEGFVLDGMTRGLERGRYQRIILEVHPPEALPPGHSAERILQKLADHGYKGVHIRNSHLEAAHDRRRETYRLVYEDSILEPLVPGAERSIWDNYFYLAPGIEVR